MSQNSKIRSECIRSFLNAVSSREEIGDFGATLAAELAYIHFLFKGADETYRLYWKALLNGKYHLDALVPTEWIPLSEQ